MTFAGDHGTRPSPSFSRVLLLFMPLSSTSAGLSSLYALSRRTAQSCSSPALWRSATKARCRSRCSRGGVPRTPPPAGRPESSSRWWWGGWGPACTARRCPCLSLTPRWRRGGPHQRRRGWRRRMATLGRRSLERKEGILEKLHNYKKLSNASGFTCVSYKLHIDLIQPLTSTDFCIVWNSITTWAGFWNLIRYSEVCTDSCQLHYCCVALQFRCDLTWEGHMITTIMWHRLDTSCKWVSANWEINVEAKELKPEKTSL